MEPSTKCDRNVPYAAPAEGWDDFFGSPKASDTQVAGSHYQLPIEPIDYIFENGLGYMEGNVIKYVTRHGSKNGEQDLRKAIHYLEMLIEREYG